MSTTEYEPQPPRHRALLAAFERARETWIRDPGPHIFAIMETGIAMLFRELGRPGKPARPLLLH